MSYLGKSHGRLWNRFDAKCHQSFKDWTGVFFARADWRYLMCTSSGSTAAVDYRFT